MYLMPAKLPDRLFYVPNVSRGIILRKFPGRRGRPSATEVASSTPFYLPFLSTRIRIRHHTSFAKIPPGNLAEDFKL